MFDLLTGITIVFVAILALYAVAQCLQDRSTPWHFKLIYSIIIIALPVFGAVMYLRQRDELDEMAQQRDGRRPRRRGRRR